jgi:hypothetical protein
MVEVSGLQLAVGAVGYRWRSDVAEMGSAFSRGGGTTARQAQWDS